ncbi:interleukin-18 receptor 1-like isoform X1 [Mobula birostris]|uniref:interleukin-18 receptor 1-like isoform X1 n=1 Tax=Mobula birostris TaxID=1983395 RepID=UPI003B27BCFE
MDAKYLALIIFCYILGRIQGCLIGKCFSKSPARVFVTEGQHVRLACNLCNASTPLDMSSLQACRFNITWYKHTSEGGHKNILGEAGRITYEETSLGFWPVFVNDTGSYSCSVFNRTYNVSSAVTSLNVHKYEQLCDVHFFDHVETIGKEHKLSCPNLEIYNSNEDNIMWVKNCKDKVHTGNTYTISKVEEKNAGNYTCVLTLGKDGMQYNVTRTIRLKTRDHIERFIPKLIYPGRREQIDVELGVATEIKCKAILGYKNNEHCMLYWLFKERDFDVNGEDPVYESRKSPVIEGNRTYQINTLVFKRIEAEHLNEPFICKLSCPETDLNGTVTLLEKGKRDCSLIFLLLFTTLAVIIIIAVVYARFKIDLALCFRDLISMDETLQDSKEYDAYVLLLKSKEALICAEVEAFALKLLPTILEQKFGYRLCIFERDVLPGTASVDEILYYINKSRTLIIILCAEYIANDSSMYGLMTGLHQALVEGLIKPILIEYIPIRDITFLPLSLQLILKSDRTVKWTNESQPQNSYFWKKIRYLMPAKYTKAAKRS